MAGAIYVYTNPKRAFGHSGIPFKHLKGFPSNEFNTLTNQKGFVIIGF
jgi:hypothetical protein